MISSTTKKLIEHSKQIDSNFTVESVRQLLIPDYHYDMTPRDVLAILLGALDEVIEEPKFEIHYGKRFYNKLVMSMFEWNFGKPQLETVNDVIENYVREIMFAFRFTRRDWS